MWFPSFSVIDRPSRHLISYLAVLTAYLSLLIVFENESQTVDWTFHSADMMEHTLYPPQVLFTLFWNYKFEQFISFLLCSAKF